MVEIKSICLVKVNVKLYIFLVKIQTLTIDNIYYTRVRSIYYLCFKIEVYRIHQSGTPLSNYSSIF